MYVLNYLPDGYGSYADVFPAGRPCRAPWTAGSMGGKLGPTLMWSLNWLWIRRDCVRVERVSKSMDFRQEEGAAAVVAKEGKVPLEECQRMRDACRSYFAWTGGWGGSFGHHFENQYNLDLRVKRVSANLKRGEIWKK